MGNTGGSKEGERDGEQMQGLGPKFYLPDLTIRRSHMLRSCTARGSNRAVSWFSE